MIWWFGARHNKMRIGFKILGAFLALFGVLLLSLFPFTLGNAIKTSDNGAIVASCIMIVIGAGFILAGRHFVQLDPAAEDPAPPVSNVTRFVVNHRRAFKVLAQLGFVLSLIRLIAACFGSDWPTRYATPFLLIGAFALVDCGRKASNPLVTDNRDWMKVPTRIRRVLEPAQKTIEVLWLGAVPLFVYGQWSHSTSEVSRLASRVILDIMTMFIYALTALFFSYGELRQRPMEIALHNETGAPIPPPGIS
jgi:hypothetical protein